VLARAADSMERRCIVVPWRPSVVQRVSCYSESSAVDLVGNDVVTPTVVPADSARKSLRWNAVAIGVIFIVFVVVSMFCSAAAIARLVIIIIIIIGLR